MGCVCIKGICPVRGRKFHRVKHIERLIRLSKKKGSPVVKPDIVDNENPADTQNAVSKPQADVVILVPPRDTEGDTKDEGAANRRKKGDAHQRFATMEAIGNRDCSEATGTPNNEGDQLKISDMPNGFSGEHISAGWPAWLISVAGEAIKGWLPMSARSFEKLDKIGQGTYSNVYRARHLETGKIVALKKVRFVNMDPESVRFMAREIHILRRLHHPNVIKLEGIITSRMSSNLYLVFEYMEHDLAGLAARPGVKFTEPQVKCYMQQFLEGLAHCHSKGILHRDIKGSNLLIDNNGVLKIADFGLATSFVAGQKEPLTSRVVTLWYRPPELLLGATEYGVAVDLWSSGCILAELFAGKPIMPGRTEVEQLHKIFKLCGSPSDEYWKKSKLPHATIFKPRHQYKRCIAETFKEFPSSSLPLLNSLLAIEPANRGTAASALASEFFKSKPLACSLSSLPKYPPSKEYNVKLRDAGNKRPKGDGANDKSESVRPGRTETKAIPPAANMVFQPVPGKLMAKNLISSYFSQTYELSYELLEKSGVQENTKRQDDHKGLELLGPGSSNNSLPVSNRTQLRTQRPCMPVSGADDFSSSAAGECTANSRYNRLDVAEASDKHTVDRPSSTHNKDNRTLSKVYGARHKGLHYSGPLIPPGVNVEDMLKEHERQIQQAVRKSRLDKVKP